MDSKVLTIGRKTRRRKKSPPPKPLRKKQVHCDGPRETLKEYLDRGGQITQVALPDAAKVLASIPKRRSF